MTLGEPRPILSQRWRGDCAGLHCRGRPFLPLPNEDGAKSRHAGRHVSLQEQLNRRHIRGSLPGACSSETASPPPVKAWRSAASDFGRHAPRIGTAAALRVPRSPRNPYQRPTAKQKTEHAGQHEGPRLHLLGNNAGIRRAVPQHLKGDRRGNRSMAVASVGGMRLQRQQRAGCTCRNNFDVRRPGVSGFSTATARRRGEQCATSAG